MDGILYKLALLLTIYKICCLFCGSLFCYFGFTLFLKGIFPNDGEMKFEALQIKVYLQRIGPGIFFALFGTAIICFTIYQPLNFQQDIGGISARNYDNPVEEIDTHSAADSVAKPLLPTTLP